VLRVKSEGLEIPSFLNQTEILDQSEVCEGQGGSILPWDTGTVLLLERTLVV